MSFAQILLLVSVTALIVYVVQLRSLLVERAVYLAGALLGVVMIMRPDWTSVIANAIGIGRGVDLLFYAFVVFSLFHSAAVLARLRRMDRQLTELARALALASASHAAAAPSNQSAAISERSL